MIKKERNWLALPLDPVLAVELLDDASKYIYITNQKIYFSINSLACTYRAVMTPIGTPQTMTPIKRPITSFAVIKFEHDLDWLSIQMNKSSLISIIYLNNTYVAGWTVLTFVWVICGDHDWYFGWTWCSVTIPYCG
jgi:hypothetical protein